jgi:glutathione S-transferase
MSDPEFDLILGTKNWSSWSLRAWLVMRQCDVSFSETVVRLRREEMRSELDDLSPSGLVPLMRHGELTVWDSLSIAEYLAELFPGKGLWPSDGSLRATARSACAEMHSGFIPMRQMMPMDFLATVKGFLPDEDVMKNINRIQSVWKMCRKKYGVGGDFLFGPWSIVDSMYAPVVSRFTTYEIELDSELSDYVAAVWETGDMQAWKSACVLEARDL